MHVSGKLQLQSINKYTLIRIYQYIIQIINKHSYTSVSALVAHVTDGTHKQIRPATQRHTAHYGQIWRHPLNQKYICSAMPPKKDWATDTGDLHTNFHEDRSAVPEICSWTDRLITILRTPTGVE